MSSLLATNSFGTGGSATIHLQHNDVWRYWSGQTGTVGTSILTNSYTTNHLETWTYWATSAGNTITINTQTANIPNLAQRIIAPVRQMMRSRKPAKNRADIKAETLLLKHLTRQQRLTWLNAKYFDVDVGERRYRIRKGWSGNVEWISKEGKKIASYCCHPDTTVPLADCALSQMMMLLYDESGFLKLANAQYYRASERQAA